MLPIYGEGDFRVPLCDGLIPFNCRNTITVGIYYGIPALQVVFAKALSQQMAVRYRCSDGGIDHWFFRQQ